MIQFNLKCDQDHRFDSWFKSTAAFEVLSSAGHLSCAICGSVTVSKAIMAPRVSTRSPTAPQGTQEKADQPLPVLSTPKTDAEKALIALRKKVEATSDYVGTNFAREARAMHLGDAPERSIYGEARPDQVRALVEEGVPLMPLPFRPKRTTQ